MSVSNEEANQEADVTYAWFDALDEHAAARAHLLTAGVPAHTVSALYPHGNFGFIAVQLATRVNSIDIRLLAAQKPLTLRRQRQNLLNLLQALPAEVAEKRKRETDASSYQAEVQPLADAFTNQFGSRSIGQNARSTCCSMLWHAWWLTGHRSELSSNLRTQLDGIAAWTGQNVLKLA